MTNREKAEEFLIHEMIYVRNNEELERMINEMCERFGECKCEFCAYANDDIRVRCDGTDQACERGVIEWLEDKTDDDN